jgi:hypothetical protein
MEHGIAPHLLVIVTAESHQKQGFLKAAGPFYACFDRPIRFHVKRITVGADGKTGVVQIHVDEKAKDGTHFQGE